MQRSRPEFRRLKPVEVIETFRETTKLKWTFGSAAAEEIERNFRRSTRVPSVDWRRTSRRVMTSERIHGIPIDERET